MTHLFTQFDGKNTKATSMSEVYKKVTNKRSGYKVAKVKVTKKVTIQVYWNPVPSSVFNPGNKYSVQDTWKLTPGDKFLVAVKTSGSIDPKKNELFVYDPKGVGVGNWGRIPGGYAKRLIESSDVEKTLFQKIADEKDNEAKKRAEQLDKQSETVDNKISSLLKEFVDKASSGTLFVSNSVSYGSARMETKSFQDCVPTATIHIDSPYSLYSAADSEIKFRFETNYSSGGYDLSGDCIKEHIDFLQSVVKIKDLFFSKYEKDLIGLLKEKRNIYAELRSLK